MNKVNLLIAMIFAVCSQPIFAQDVDSSEPVLENTRQEKISADGTIKVEIDSNLPKTGLPLTINLRFSDTSTGDDLANINYDIVAIQNGEITLSQLGLYSPSGRSQHTTLALSTDNHVEIMIILQGIGETAPYRGPQGEALEVSVVPEFGVIAPIIFLISTTIVLALQKFYRRHSE
jgi:hypothetical protein